MVWAGVISGVRYGHTNLIGEVVTLETADARRVTWCYVSDPEGNVVELQSWARAG